MEYKDENTNVDTDNIAILTSTGTYGSTRTVVEAYVRYAGGEDEYAQEHYDAASSGQAGGGAVTGSKCWAPRNLALFVCLLMISGT